MTVVYYPPMRLKYREDKTTQAAARLLQRAGGRMNHMKLIKLLYLAERRALVRWGRPITFDYYVSMPHGPVLSFTLNKLNEESSDESSYWHSVISERRDHEVRLLGDAPSDQLSRAEEALLDEVYEEFGHLSQWQLRDFSHTLPEWQDPHGSSTPIEIRDILMNEGLTEEDVREVEDALRAEDFAERIGQG